MPAVSEALLPACACQQEPAERAESWFGWRAQKADAVITLPAPHADMLAGCLPFRFVSPQIRQLLASNPTRR